MWIAFNLITFVDITQPNGKNYSTSWSCELLSIWLLLWISHSTMIHRANSLLVVNCFQFDYFCGYHTAYPRLHSGGFLLWIAFNLITFVDITQPTKSRPYKTYSCELLSIWLLLWISHSRKYKIVIYEPVVNCFQFDYFCGYHTAWKSNICKPHLLWIAFNLITFVDITQPIRSKPYWKASCELLSIWLLLWISHS